MPNIKLKASGEAGNAFSGNLLKKLGINRKQLKKGVDVDVNPENFSFADLRKISDVEATEQGVLTKAIKNSDYLETEIDITNKPDADAKELFKGIDNLTAAMYMKKLNVKNIDDKSLRNLGELISSSGDLQNGRKMLQDMGLEGDELNKVWIRLKKVGDGIFTRLQKRLGLLDEAGNRDLVQSLKLVVAGGVVTVVGYLVYFVIANAGKIPEAVKDVMVSLGESAGDAAAFAAETAADVASGGLDTFFKGLSLPLLIGGVVFFVFFIIMMIMMR